MHSTDRTEPTAVNEPKVEPMSRKERRRTARFREQRVNQYEKNMQQRFHELQAKIASMDAYFIELASIAGLDLEMIVKEGGKPDEVMRDRIGRLTAFARLAEIKEKEERAG